MIIESDVFQDLAALAIAAAGLLVLWIAASAQRVNRYGREALAGSAVFMLTTAIVRFLLIYDVLSSAEARTGNSVAAIIVLLIIAQAAFLSHKSRAVNGYKGILRAPHRRA